jgi:hypothetical protein
MSATGNRNRICGGVLVSSLSQQLFVLEDAIYDPFDLKIEKNFDRPFVKFTELLFLPAPQAPYKLYVAATLQASSTAETVPSPYSQYF